MVDNEINMGGIPSEETFGHARLSMRNYFSTNFLWTALHMSRLVGELEMAAGSVPRFDMAHRSYAASCVIPSATFLEAASANSFKMRLTGTAFATTATSLR